MQRFCSKILFATFPLFASSNGFARDQTTPVLNRWFALGSGCKASSEVAGDVEFRTTELLTNKSYKGVFRLTRFSLDVESKQPIPQGRSTEAKECALRLNINPPKNKRIKFVTASTSLSQTKSNGNQLTSLFELKIGTETLARKVLQSYENENFSRKLTQIQLIPGRDDGEQFPKLECGQGKILAVNLTFLTKRTDAKESVFVTLDGQKKVEVIVDLEDCKK